MIHNVPSTIATVIDIEDDWIIVKLENAWSPEGGWSYSGDDQLEIDIVNCELARTPLNGEKVLLQYVMVPDPYNSGEVPTILITGGSND